MKKEVINYYALWKKIEEYLNSQNLYGVTVTFDLNISFLETMVFCLKAEIERIKIHQVFPLA